MHNVKIAVVDNGIDEALLKRQLNHRVYINHDGQCIFDNADMNKVSFMHGTTCALIIEKYLSDFSISSVRILSENGSGLIEALYQALEWCLKNEIKVVNLSLGTKHFKDKALVRSLINRCANQGMCIIAATANSGYITYPASFSNVIGVAMEGNEHCEFIGNEHIGIDVAAPSGHELNICGRKIISRQSNSYAAPYVTALIGKLLLEMGLHNIAEIKQALRTHSEYNMRLLSEYYEPDWIGTALVRIRKTKSKANYYFNYVNGTISQVPDHADTIITDNLAELEEAGEYNKNIVYLGKENIEKNISGRFFWSPKKRLKQIFNCVGEKKELNIPVILCEFDESMDEMFLLTELRRNFNEDNYNIYTASLEADSILYDLEYIPRECLEAGDIKYFNSFIYWQTYYKQSDGIILGIKENVILECGELLQQTDMRIVFKQLEGKQEATVWCDGAAYCKKIFEKTDSGSIKLLYQNIKRVLTEK
ncbi:subtilase family protein [Anaerobacterium chartisolvens]|uniref:Subtilase family protein n=1 Tax=Anaerobacterium chartisolvens TaxID=1297424 RepID=A0A369ATA4_9FIRM|nr:S8 family serine peptidase [Anaerobacterium chartisolvens]RCX12213.1 subtilase family protein [Anaerobacterium chartisolvens]